METFASGYWDFYQDSSGQWRWRFACTELQQIITSAKPHDSSDECIQDAMEHGYSRSSDYRVTRAIG